MNKIINIRDMNAYTKELKNSYAFKRELHTEYSSLLATHNYNYTKVQYVREKFPKFPLTLRKQISEFI